MKNRILFILKNPEILPTISLPFRRAEITALRAYDSGVPDSTPYCSTTPLAPRARARRVRSTVAHQSSSRRLLSPTAKTVPASSKTVSGRDRSPALFSFCVSSSYSAEHSCRYTSAIAWLVSRDPTGHTHTPWGSLSCEAASSCQTGRQIPTDPKASKAWRIRRVFNSATDGSEWEFIFVWTLGSSLKQTMSQ